ncbi:MAG: class I SAM-dependent methyltransferase [Halobacteria archaeon]
MIKSIDETAERFDEVSDCYDEEYQDEVAARTSFFVIEKTLNRTDEGSKVVDLGCGTGRQSLNVAPHVKEVVGFDVSDGMLEQAQGKIANSGLENIELREGRFRDHDADEVDAVISNFAMHHLDDDAKREAIGTVRETLDGEGCFILGDVVVYEPEDVDAGYYDPEVDDPAMIGDLLSMFREDGFEIEYTRTGKVAGVFEATTEIDGFDEV